MKEPKGGWNDSALADIFSHTLPRDTYVYPNTSSSKHSSPKPSPTSQPSSNNTGAIAGGVVGGVVVLALIGLAIWFFTWRPRRQTDQQDGRSNVWNKPELHGQEVRAGSHLKPSELDPRGKPSQLETNTDRAELDAYQYAIAMQGVQSPVELEAWDNRWREERLSERDQVPPK